MSLEKFNLIGKTALITGAGGFLGAEHAAALLESGSSVILTDVNEDSLDLTRTHLLKSFEENKILCKVLDVTNFKNMHMLAAELSTQDIFVDILVNNAAIDHKVKANKSFEASRLEHFSIDQWDREIAVGLTGAFLASQVFGAIMVKSGKGGVILNIASDLSVFSPDQRLYMQEGLSADLQAVKPITYSVIKTGLVGLTRYLATYWCDKNVRCNALSPGGVYNNQGDDFVKRLSLLIPLGRMARRDEYRSAVQFLCSDASSYLTGQNIVVDGGRSIW